MSGDLGFVLLGEAATVAYDLWSSGLVVVPKDGGGGCRVVPRPGHESTARPMTDALRAGAKAHRDTFAAGLQRDASVVVRTCMRAEFNGLIRTWSEAFRRYAGELEERERERIGAIQAKVVAAIRGADREAFGKALEAWCAAATPFRWLPHGRFYRGGATYEHQMKVYAYEARKRGRSTCLGNGECGGACRVSVDGPDGDDGGAREAYEERAAIVEFHGERSRAEAEIMAARYTTEWYDQLADDLFRRMRSADGEVGGKHRLGGRDVALAYRLQAHGVARRAYGPGPVIDQWWELVRASEVA